MPVVTSYPFASRCRVTGPGVESEERVVFALYYIQRHLDIHRTFDGRAADLAITLSGVGVPNGEQGTFNLDREVKRGPSRQIADVQIATHASRWHDRVKPRLSRGEANGAGEGLQRHLGDIGKQRRRQRFGIVVPDLEVGIGELIRQRPKPGMFAVQPKPDGWKASILTFSTSPGLAPST